MEMQDKEFDDLFRSKLDGFEVGPSAHVWPGIVGELTAGKRKKLLLPFLSVAASIAVLVTAGVLFIPQKINAPAKSNVKTKTIPALVQRAANALAVIKRQPVVLVSKSTGKLNTSITAKTNAPGAMQPITQVIAAVNSQVAKPIVTTTKSKKQSLEELTQKGAITALVPDSSTQIVIKHSMQISPAFITNPAIAAVQLPVAGKQDVLPVKTSRKVHSIGHFINSLVATVDKRQDKFIEFTDIDDEGSVLTGVNLGFVKIKKEK